MADGVGIGDIGDVITVISDIYLSRIWKNG